jgi:DNA-binding CsgD family transcriptional regulator
VSDVVGVSEATVKTHLQRVFAKTNTNRQTELIKLVAAHASPLRRQ